MTATDMRPSLNEIEQLTAKAARGAGNGWGLAEDIARATRWRADRGLGWSEALLRLLRAGPVADRFGAVFMAADLLSSVRSGDRWTLQGCEPGWVLPLLSAALPGRNVGLDLAWNARRVRLAPDGSASADRALAGQALDDAEDISVEARLATDALAHPLRAAGRRSPVPAADWDALGAYAIRTYVAASAQSRAGAGGGRVDDD